MLRPPDRMVYWLSLVSRGNALTPNLCHKWCTHSQVSAAPQRPQHQHRLRTGYTCRFLDPTQDLLIRISGAGAQPSRVLPSFPGDSDASSSLRTAALGLPPLSNF